MQIVEDPVRPERMKFLTSFSNHLLTMGVRATGWQSFRDVRVKDLGTGTMLAILKQAGTTDMDRERLKSQLKYA